MVRVILAMIGLAVLAGCGGQGPGRGAPTPADAGRERVTVEGVGFTVDLREGPEGKMLTRQGIVSTQGLAAYVRRADGAMLASSEGRIAKAAAVRACDQAGGRLNTAAQGRYEGAGVWVFNGACAR